MSLIKNALPIIFVFFSITKLYAQPTTWDSATAYSVGDLVVSGESTYIAIATSTNQTPPNTTYWTDLTVAAAALGVPQETVPSLDTTTILASLSALESPDGNSSSNVSRLLGISTRGLVTASSFLHAGVIVSGTVNKKVVFMAKGPLLSNYGVSGVLADPYLEVYNSSGSLIYSNDSWGAADSSISISQDIGKTGITSPSSSLEAGLTVSLSPGAYTAILKGTSSSSGSALVEAYELYGEELDSKLLGISTRGSVTTTSFLYAGIAVTGTNSKKVAFMGKGPLLSNYGVAGVLSDPYIEIYNSTGTLIYSNDSHTSVTGTGAELISSYSSSEGITLPSSSLEAAIVVDLSPGNYSAILKGANGTSGIGLIEAYEVSSN